MNHISISEVKRIREQLGLTHLVIFGIDTEGLRHVATHGKTVVDAKQAAEAGNNLKKELGWPAQDCKSKPLERKCINCAFVIETIGCTSVYYQCGVEPKTSSVEAHRVGCRWFEPKF